MQPADIRTSAFTTTECVVVATDAYWDGVSYERDGRNTHVLKDKEEPEYWVMKQSTHVSEPSVAVTRVTREEAVDEYLRLSERVPWSDAFE